MKDYPLDKFEPVMFWPMEAATRVPFRAVKFLLVLLYVPWFFLCIPVAFPLLLVSMAMLIWDDVNGRG